MSLLKILVLLFCTGACSCQKTMADNIQQCPDNKGTYVDIRNVKLYRKAGRPDQFFDYDLYVTRKINLKSAVVKATVKTCPNKDGDKGCNNLPEIKLKNVCNLIHVPSLQIERFFICLDQHVECTFEKRLYKGRNCSVDMNQFKLVNLGRYYWSGKVEVLKGKEQILCMAGQLHMDYS